MANLFIESLELTEDTAYQEIYTDLSVKTKGWSEPSGEVRYADKTDADIAVSILSDRYTNVKLNPLDFKDGDDLSYHVVYSDNTDEELEEEKKKKFDPNGLNYMTNKNPEGTPIGIGNPVSGGMGEDLEEDFESTDDEIECPHCGGHAEYIEGQGNFRFYKCLDCGEYLFKNSKGVIKKADDAFDTEGNLLKESSDEDGGNDSEDVQQFYASIDNPEQNDKIEELNNHFKGLGFDIANFEQIIPGKDYNMYFKLIKLNANDNLDGYRESIISELEKLGANNLEDIQASNENDKFYIHGPFFLEGMALEEDKESEDIDEAIEKHDELNQKIFNGEELDSKVKDKLLEIVDKFKESLEADEVKLDIKDVVIVGSSASYNYTKDSDIDLHIIADLSTYPNQEELAAKLYNAYKSLFNNKYDPTIHGIPVEVYVEPEGMKANSKGRYSLYNGWVDAPEKEDIPETPDIKDKYKEFEDKAKACETIEDIDNFMDNIYNIRQNSLLTDGEFGGGNLIFKELRNNNILQNLKDKKVELENKEMSLEETLTEEVHNVKEIILRELRNNFPDLTLDDYYEDDEVVVMYLIDEDGIHYKVSLHLNEYEDENDLAYGVYNEIEAEIEDTKYSRVYSDGTTLHTRHKFIITWVDLDTNKQYEEVEYAPTADKAEDIFINDMRENMHMLVDEDYEIVYVEEAVNEEVIEEASEEDVKAKALANYLDISIEAIDADEDDLYNTPEGDYLVYTDEEADKAAKDEIVMTMENVGLHAFTDNFREFIKANCIKPELIDNFIADEIDYYRTQEEDPEMVAYLEGMDFSDELDYIYDLYDEENFAKWLIENNGLDIDKIVDEAIFSDGRGQFVSMYDGNEIELDNNLFAYREN